MADEANRNNTGKIAGLGCAAVGGGCLLVVVVLGVFAVIAGFWVASNVKNIAADFGGAAATQMIQESKLPAEQKARIVTRIDEVKEGFKAGEVTQEELGAIFQALADSPMFSVAMVEHFQATYIAGSTLTEEEKQQARRTLDRFARGLYEESIPFDAVEEVTAPISETDAQGDQQLKSNPTADELREALALAQARADEADVPDEAFEIDYAAEFDRAVDKALSDAPDAEQPSIDQPATAD